MGGHLQEIYLQLLSDLYGQFKKIFAVRIIREFDNIPITDEQKPKVGIVGEILVKFLPAANNHLVELLEAEGAEAVMPDLIDFLLYCFYNSNFKTERTGRKNLLPPLPTWESNWWNSSAKPLQKNSVPAVISHRRHTSKTLPTMPKISLLLKPDR